MTTSSSNHQVTSSIAAVILAGGQSKRMQGTPKLLVPLQGKSLLEHCLDRISPQVNQLIVNTHLDIPPDSRIIAKVADIIPDFQGPLTGVLTAMRWLQENSPSTEWLATLSIDTPFIPQNLVCQLYHVNHRDARIICPIANGRKQPLCGLWKVNQANDLQDAIVNRGLKKVHSWLSQQNTVYCDLTQDLARHAIDPFFNINTPQDLAYTEAILGFNQTKPHDHTL